MWQWGCAWPPRAGCRALHTQIYQAKDSKVRVPQRGNATARERPSRQSEDHGRQTEPHRSPVPPSCSQGKPDIAAFFPGARSGKGLERVPRLQPRAAKAASAFVGDRHGRRPVRMRRAVVAGIPVKKLTLKKSPGDPSPLISRKVQVDGRSPPTAPSARLRLPRPASDRCAAGQANPGGDRRSRLAAR
jgi:hypothetical protein